MLKDGFQLEAMVVVTNLLETIRLVEAVEQDSGMGSEDSQAGVNERLLPPMEPSAR